MKAAHILCCCVLGQVTELECVSAQTSVIKTQKTELNQTIEELEAELKAKEQVRLQHLLLLDHETFQL